MKKILLLSAILLLGSVLTAQDTYVFRVTLHSVYDRATETLVDLQEETGYLCIIDMDKNVVTFLNKAGTKFYKSLPEVSIRRGVDSDGDAFISTTYNGVDEEGISCGATILTYININFTVVQLRYKDVILSFGMNQI